MNLTEIQLEEIHEHIDPYAIKNFIISDQPLSLPSLSSNFPFSINAIAFAICVSGRAKVMINFREYEVTKNTTITIMPHYVIEYLERSDDLLIEFLIFAPDFITDMPKTNNIDISHHVIRNPCLLITEEDADRYLEYHSFIVKQYKRKDHPFRTALAKALLYALLIEVGSIYFNQIEELQKKEFKPRSHQEDLVYRFFTLVLEHHKMERTVEFYADKMCLTPKYVSTMIKEKTGRTAFAWINEVVIASIKYLLKTTNKTILQISEDLNFPNPSFFGRFFKKHTGLTPIQYRES